MQKQSKSGEQQAKETNACVSSRCCLYEQTLLTGVEQAQARRRTKANEKASLTSKKTNIGEKRKLRDFAAPQ
jgi:hypothetical protein